MECPHCKKEVFGKGHDVEDFYKEAPELTEEEKLKQRIKELEELLTEYGRHQPGCPAQYDKKYKCRCGWDREKENKP